MVDCEGIEFSGGFRDLHTEVYRKTLASEGFGFDDARPSTELVHRLRHADLQTPREHFHPFTKGYTLG
jgi:UDP-N-acetyl-2-amino-2-deoxyglucuronate dehydrogenase